MQDSTVIALLRHADYHQPEGVPSALLPYPLNERGFEQVAAAIPMLQDYATAQRLDFVPEIDSSTLLRAWQTASLIAEGLSLGQVRALVVQESEALAERSVGAVANLTVSEIEKLLDDDPRYEVPPLNWKSDSHYRLPFSEAESLMEAGARVAAHVTAAMDQLASEDRGGLKIIVGHGASIRHAAVHLGLMALTDVGKYSMYHATPLFVTRRGDGWHQVGGRWKVRVEAAHSDEFNTGRS